MSLLMDALRKAEQAKRQAETAAQRGGPPASEIEPLVQAESQPPQRGAPLPELPSKLELLDDQFSQAAAPAAPKRPAPAPAPKPSVEEVARERKAAQLVFAAKEPEEPSRRGFYFGLAGATLAAMLAIGGYFWWQLRPPASIAAVPLPQNRSAATAPPAAAPMPATGATNTAAGLSSGSLAAAAPEAKLAAPAAGRTALPPEEDEEEAAPAAVRPARAPRPAPERGQFAEPRPVLAAETSIRVTRSRLQTDPALERGYRNFQSGKLTTAHGDYSQALRQDPHNIDALNGLAAIALAGGDARAAESYYQRALETDPRDPTAQAGLLGLRGNADPVQAEGRLKTLAAAQPEAHGTHFTLGNLYAAQGRWHEAQQAYFRAYSGDPENPDYQFNLAVSLDQLRQPRLAQQYYEGALAAAATRPGAFDRALAAARIRELKQP